MIHHRNEPLTTLLRLLLFASVACVGFGASAAPINHGDFVGTDVTFFDVTETTQTQDPPNPDPDELFGEPTVVGNQLLFFPSSFSATSSGGGADSTLSLLQTEIVSTSAGFAIESLRIQEFGDTVFSGTGTTVTKTEVALSGFITVTARNGVSGFFGVVPFIGSVSPNALGEFDLVNDPSPTIWSGLVEVDLVTATGFNDITTVELSFDNQLDAFSEAASSATIQKKVVDGPAIVVTVIPEPTTVLLLGSGLVGLALSRRARKE